MCPAAGWAHAHSLGKPYLSAKAPRERKIPANIQPDTHPGNLAASQPFPASLTPPRADNIEARYGDPHLYHPSSQGGGGSAADQPNEILSQNKLVTKGAEDMAQW